MNSQTDIQRCFTISQRADGLDFILGDIQEVSHFRYEQVIAIKILRQRNILPGSSFRAEQAGFAVRVIPGDASLLFR